MTIATLAMFAGLYGGIALVIALGWYEDRTR